MPCKSCREKRVAMYLARGMLQAEAEKRADKIMPLIEKVLTKRPRCGRFNAFDEWTNYYLAKGFQKREAEKLTEKLLKKLDARIKYERLDFIPLYLLERSGEGVLLYYRRLGRIERFKSGMHVLLYRWAFLTQWRATFLQSFKQRRLLWIGRGFNPDYTQVCSPCTKSGSCNILGECVTTADCYTYTVCTPVCPTPLANSTLTNNTCSCVNGGCGCLKGSCTGLIGTCAAPTGGPCEYTCTPPYTWNVGLGQCVSGVTTKLWMTLKGRGGDASQRLKGKKTLKGFLSMVFGVG